MALCDGPKLDVSERAETLAAHATLVAVRRIGLNYEDIPKLQEIFEQTLARAERDWIPRGRICI